MNKRFIVILENKGLSPKEYKSLFNLFKKILVGYKLNDIRIGNFHIEIDLFSSNKDFLKLLNEFKIIEVRDLSEQMQKNIFEFAKELFNKERFWEFHEVLESLWRKNEGKEKNILHGLILIAAAFVHKQRGNDKVALSVLKRAFLEIENYEGMYQCFDITYIKNKVSEMLNNRYLKEFRI
jgi:Domain of unknown function (DUF309).